MADEKLKDDILRAVLGSPNQFFTDFTLAKILNVRRAHIEYLIKQLEADFRGEIVVRPGTGDSAARIAIDKNSVGIEQFLNKGGYEGAAETKRIEREQAKYKAELEVKHLELAVAAAHEARLSAESADKRAKSAVQAAWFAGIIAALTLLYMVLAAK